MKQKRKIAWILTVVLFLSVLASSLDMQTTAAAAGSAATEENTIPSKNDAGKDETVTQTADTGIEDETEEESTVTEQPADDTEKTEVSEPESTPTPDAEPVKEATGDTEGADAALKTEAAETSDQIKIVNADEALVVGWQATYEADTTLPEDGLTLQWQVSEDGENWTNLEGQTDWYYSFDVTEDVFGKWFRIAATVADGTVHYSKALQPVKAVCYVETSGGATTRASGTIEGYGSLQEAFDQGKGKYEGAFTITLLENTTISEPLKLYQGMAGGNNITPINTGRTNTYTLESVAGKQCTISLADGFSSSQMFVQTDNSYSIYGQRRKMELILRNVSILGYQVDKSGQEVVGGKKVETLIETTYGNANAQGYITIQGGTQLLNPGRTIVDYSAGAAEQDALKINSGQEGASEGPIKIIGKVVLPDVAQHIRVYGTTANFTSDTDVAIQCAGTYTDNTTLVEYTAEASPYEIAYFRLSNPGNWWIAFKDETTSGSGVTYTRSKIKNQLAVQNNRPDRVFVTSETRVDTDGAPAQILEATTDYNDGVVLDARYISKEQVWDKYICGVNTLAGGYARIQQLNRDEGNGTKADLVIGQTQKLTQDCRIEGTYYNDGTHEFSWATPADILRYFYHDGDSLEDAAAVGQSTGFRKHYYGGTLLELTEGTLTLRNVTVSGDSTNISVKFAIDSPLIKSSGSGAVLSGATLKDNPGKVLDKGSYGGSIPIGEGSGIAITSGNLTLQEQSVISNCALVRKAIDTAQQEVKGAGIYFTGGGTLSITNSRIENNIIESDGGAYGGGIYIEGAGSQLLLNDGAVISGNSPFSGESTNIATTTKGLGIAVVKGAYCKMDGEGSSVTGNTSEGSDDSAFGGGFFVSDATVDLIRGEITGNTLTGTAISGSTQAGGGMYITENSVVNSHINISGNIIGRTDVQNNQAGGIHVNNGATLNLLEGNIFNNVASNGGGIYAENATVTIGAEDKPYPGEIYGNTANYSGGGISVNKDTVFKMYGGRLYGNQSGDYGGGIYADSVSLNLIGTVIGASSITQAPETKEAALAAGGNVSDGRYGDGGGLALGGKFTVQPVISGVTMQGNWATRNGGGLLDLADISDVANVSLTLEGNCAIKMNTAQNGGGIASFRNDGQWKQSADYTLIDRARTFHLIMTSGTSVENNYALKNGGGLFADTLTEIYGDQVVFKENRAGQDGGGVYLNTSDPTSIVDFAWNSYINENNKPNFRIDCSSARVRFTNSSFTDNRAVRNGGAACTDQFLLNSLTWNTDELTEEYLTLYRDIMATATDPIRGTPGTLSLENCTIQQNTATAGNGIYQGDGTVLELSKNLVLDANQTVWLGKSTIDIMIPETSDNSHKGTYYRQTPLPKINATAHTGAFITIAGDLSVNGDSTGATSIPVDFPNYEGYKVIAQYNDGVVADAGESYDIEKMKYSPDATKLAASGGLYVEKYEALNQVLLLPPVDFQFTKYGADTDGDGTADILPGAKFKLYECKKAEEGHTHSEFAGTEGSCWTAVKDADGEDKVYTSDENGLVDFGGLVDGEYRLEEIEAPAGYQPPPGQWKITIDSTKAIIETAELMIHSEIIKKDSVEQPNVIIKLEDGGNRGNSAAYQNTLQNKASYGTKFSFIKVKAEDTDAVLSGVEFELYTCNNAAHTHATSDEINPLVTQAVIEAGDCWKLVRTVTSAADGTVDFGSLINGTYMLLETKTAEGYQLPTGQWKITIDNTKKLLERIAITAVSSGGKIPPGFIVEQDTGAGTGIVDIHYKLLNIKETWLPFTGLDGIFRYLLIGGTFIAIAIMLFLFFKKRGMGIESKKNLSEGGDSSS